MSKERLEKLLKELEEAKITNEEAKIANYKKIAFFQKKLVYIDNAPQEFQLDEEIKLAEKEIQDIDIRIESLEQEIRDIKERLSLLPPDPPPDPPPPPPPDPPLPLLKGNYDQLSRLLLEEQEWKAADVETMQVILHIAEKTKEGWLTSQDIADIPSEDLKKIDSLWLKASNRKFGYSVQRDIWLKIQYKSKNSDRSINYDPSLFLKFAKQVGWRVNNNSLMNYDDFDFSLNAPDGHLPTFWCLSSTVNYMKWRHTFEFFLPRL